MPNSCKQAVWVFTKTSESYINDKGEIKSKCFKEITKDLRVCCTS